MYIGGLGIGSKSPNTVKFEEASFPEETKNIKNFFTGGGRAANADYFNLILTTTGNLYFSGKHDNSKGGKIKLTSSERDELDTVLNWSKVDTKTMFPNLDFSKVICTGATARWHNSYWFFYEGNKCYQMLWNGTTSQISPWGDCENVRIYTGSSDTSCCFAIIKKSDSVEYWYRGIPSYSGIFGETNIKEDWVNIDEKFSEIESEISSVWLDSFSMALKLVNGRYYGIGDLSRLGEGDVVKYDTWTELTSLEKFGKDFIFPESYKLFAFRYDNSKIVGIKCPKELFGENLLIRDWELIDTNVKYFNPSRDEYSYAVVKEEDNVEKLYVRGKYSDYLGLYKVGESVESLECVTGEGSTSEVKEAINSGIKKYAIQYRRLYVYTKNNMVLMSCCESRNSAWMQGYNGYGVVEDCPYLKKINDNITDFFASTSLLMVKGNKILVGGCANTGYEGFSYGKEMKEAPKIWQDVGKIYNYNDQSGIFLLGEKQIIVHGYARNDGWSNGTNHNINGDGEILKTSEKMIDVASTSLSHILLSESGKVYGCGLDSRIGNGKGNLGGVTYELSCIFDKEKVTSVAAGNEFVVCITESGNVYGTGSNVNGVLGRWKGAPRDSGRYRTAFEWVECPELEL